MKKLIYTSFLALLFFCVSASNTQDYPQEYLGLPGDNLNLYAVMDLFRESATLETFERSLNNPDKIINNLDLNNDNFVDYIMVKDYVDGSVHTIVLSVALNSSEYQDVAVFTVEQFRDGSVQIQLIGDEALYGKNYIIEPVYAETPNPGYQGTNANHGTTGQTTTTVVTTTYVQVAAWPVIHYIFMPSYVVYYSPWRWGYYPTYWATWRPHYWHYYYGYHYHWHSHYYSYYRPWPHYRYPRYHTFYYSSFRHTSPYVATNVREGRYRNTYSRPEELSRGQNQYHAVHGSRADNTQGAVSGRNASTQGTSRATTVNSPRTYRQSQAAVSGTSSKGTSDTRQQAASAPSRGSSATRQRAETAPSRGASNNRQQAVPARGSSATRQQAETAPSRGTSNNRQQATTSTSNRKSEPRRESAPTSVRNSNNRREASPASARSSNPTRSQSSREAVKTSSPRNNSSSASGVRKSSSGSSSKSNVSTPSRSSSRGSQIKSSPSRGSSSPARSSSSSRGQSGSSGSRTR